MADEPTFTLKLTEREVWHLREGYEASFTDPEGRNEYELAVSAKLDDLFLRSRKKAKQKGG